MMRVSFRDGDVRALFLHQAGKDDGQQLESRKAPSARRDRARTAVPAVESDDAHEDVVVVHQPVEELPRRGGAVGSASRSRRRPQFRDVLAHGRNPRRQEHALQERVHLVFHAPHSFARFHTLDAELAEQLLGAVLPRPADPDNPSHCRGRQRSGALRKGRAGPPSEEVLEAFEDERCVGGVGRDDRDFVPPCVLPAASISAPGSGPRRGFQAGRDRAGAPAGWCGR